MLPLALNSTCFLSLLSASRALTLCVRRPGLFAGFLAVLCWDRWRVIVCLRIGVILPLGIIGWIVTWFMDPNSLVPLFWWTLHFSLWLWCTMDARFTWCAGKVRLVLPVGFEILLSGGIECLVKLHVELRADMSRESAEDQGDVPVVNW